MKAMQSEDQYIKQREKELLKQKNQITKVLNFLKENPDKSLCFTHPRFLDNSELIYKVYILTPKGNISFDTGGPQYFTNARYFLTGRLKYIDSWTSISFRQVIKNWIMFENCIWLDSHEMLDLMNWFKKKSKKQLLN